MNKLYILLPLFLTTFVFSNYEEELLEKATIHYFEKEYKKAYDLSVDALIYYPQHPYAYLYIGTYLLSIGKVHDATGYFDKAINYHDSVFPPANWERAFCKMMINRDLSYCEDINIIKENFAVDDTYKYLERENNIVFGLCNLASNPPHLLISSANFLAQTGSCDYALLFYNEATKRGTQDELSNYDRSICN